MTDAILQQVLCSHNNVLVMKFKFNAYNLVFSLVQRIRSCPSAQKRENFFNK